MATSFFDCTVLKRLV